MVIGQQMNEEWHNQNYCWFLYFIFDSFVT